MGVTVHHKHPHLPCHHGHSGIPAPSVVGDGVVFIRHHIHVVIVCLQRVGRHHVASPPCCHWEELLHHKVKASRHLDTGVATEDGHRGVGHHDCASEVLAALELQAVVGLQEQAEHGAGDVGSPSIVESGSGGDADSSGGGTGGHHKLGQAISVVPNRCHHVVPGAQALHRQESSGTHRVALGADGHHGDVSAGLNHQGFMGSAASSEFQASGEEQGHSDVWLQGDVPGDGAAAEHHRHLGVGRTIGGEQQLQVRAGGLVVVLWEHSQELPAPVAGTGEHWENGGKGGPWLIFILTKGVI